MSMVKGQPATWPCWQNSRRRERSCVPRLQTSGRHQVMLIVYGSRQYALCGELLNMLHVPG